MPAFPRALPKNITQIYGLPGGIAVPLALTFGAAGVVTSFKGMFLQTVVRNSAGNYTLTFDRPMLSFQGALGWWWKLAGATEALIPNSTAASPDNVGTGANPNTMVINTKAGSTPTDPAEGDVLYLWPIWNESQRL